MGKEKGPKLKSEELDKNVYEPYLTETGVIIDPKYNEMMQRYKDGLLEEESLLEAGRRFLALHNAQYRAVKENPKKVKNRKAFRNKAFVESVLCGWSYVAGLLQTHKNRLKNHYKIPKATSKIPDPLNAAEMSTFKHDSDPSTYRGLGTRSSLKDRQRLAQVFLAKSLKPDCIFDRRFLDEAVSRAVGLIYMKRGYTKNV